MMRSWTHWPNYSEQLAPTFLCPMEDLAALGQDLLQRGHSLRLQARGWSMHPAIRDGEVVWIASIEANSIKRGQVVFYIGAGGRPLIHRVIRKHCAGDQTHLHISSDRTPAGGEWVPAGQVLGRVVAIERAGRRFLLDGWRGRLWGWIFLVLRPFRPLISRLRRR